MSTWAGRKPTADEWRDILEKHARWMRGDGGELADLTRADLTGANLYRADLTGADLTGADLTGADLTGADLTRANLTGADLYRANLTGADLTGADLTRADLTRANLTGADLTGADLTRADLTRANLTGADLYRADLTGADLTGALGDLPIYRFQIVPESGAFVGWKKLRDGLIAQLEIPATAGRVGGLLGRKCRASKARVLAIWRGKKREPSREGFSLHDASFAYRVGKIVAPEDGWCDDPRVECASGIHFYITRREAEEHA